MRRFLVVLSFALLAVAAMSAAAWAQGKPSGDGVRAKFYDFSEQLIDGEIKKPTALYTDARQTVRFDRLMRLRKSFIPAMMQTAKQPSFK
jgi:hypothetical protein